MKRVTVFILDLTQKAHEAESRITRSPTPIKKLIKADQLFFIPNLTGDWPTPSQLSPLNSPPLLSIYNLLIYKKLIYLHP